MPLQLKPATECRFDLVSLGEVMLRLDPGETLRQIGELGVGAFTRKPRTQALPDTASRQPGILLVGRQRLEL